LKKQKQFSFDFKNRKQKQYFDREKQNKENRKQIIKANKAMKTKNNVQKTVTRSAAVIVSFVLISFTVTAQDFWKTILTNSSFNQIALAMVETSKKTNVPEKTSGTNAVNYFYESENDAVLVVEDWMTENDYFKPAAFIQAEKENDLRIEEWMLNENLFSAEVETDTKLKVENWMISSEVWN
jgi:hypothetical protein